MTLLRAATRSVTNRLELRFALDMSLHALLLAALGAFVLSNLFMVALQGAAIWSGSDALDWRSYVEASHRWGGDLYTRDVWWYGWRYSPVAVPIFGLLAPMGEGLWRLLHFAALGMLPHPVRLFALASYPFWFDVHAGNVLIFVVIAAYWALRGNKWGTGVFLVLALLIPRPLMLPIVAWILWKRPEWRLWFVAIFVAHAVAVAASGYGDDWLARLTQVGGEEVMQDINAAPSALIGVWWMIAAVPVAAWMFSRGLPAAAGLFLQPYWLPYYLLILLADDSVPRFVRRLTRRADRSAASSRESVRSSA
jgi:hypothetical protein